MMRMLFVSSHFPYPTVTHGGGTDLFHLIEALSRRHAIDLVSSILPWEQRHEGSMQPYCRKVVTVVPAVGRRERLGSALRQAVTRPWLLGRRAQWLIGEALSNALAEERYDVVQLVFTAMGRHVPLVRRRAVTVLDEVDVSFLPLLNRYQRARGWWPRARAYWRYRRGLAQELGYCRAVDQILVRSARDLEALRLKLPDVRGALLKPWTHVAEYVSIAPTRAAEPVVLFAGAMNRVENVDAATFFYRDCLPAVRARVPDARFVIAGADPPLAIARLATTDPCVTVTGRVESLRPYYEAARVCVAPVRHEGGVMNKVIDGMAAHRPVVTTSAGNAGVGASHGEHLLVADDASAFAEAVVAALTRPDLSHRLGRAGRTYVVREFNWDRTVAGYEALMEELVSSHRVPSEGVA